MSKVKNASVRIKKQSASARYRRRTLHCLKEGRRLSPSSASRYRNSFRCCHFQVSCNFQDPKGCSSFDEIIDTPAMTGRNRCAVNNKTAFLPFIGLPGYGALSPSTKPAIYPRWHVQNLARYEAFAYAVRLAAISEKCSRRKNVSAPVKIDSYAAVDREVE